MLSNLLARSGAIVGDVAFYHLLNMRKLLSLNDRDIKRNVRFRIICLKKHIMITYRIIL